MNSDYPGDVIVTGRAWNMSMTLSSPLLKESFMRFPRTPYLTTDFLELDDCGIGARLVIRRKEI